MSFDLQGKVALVTGANRGIGKTIAEALLREGVSKVYAAVRNPQSASDLVQAHQGKVVALELDLTKPETITAAAKQADDVQLVVNNGGVLKASNPLEEKAFESFQFELDVNVYGLMRMAQAFAPVLKHNGGGAFVQLNSVASVKAFVDLATYCASKAAAYSITQSLRISLGEQGTQVVSVHPGPISTDMAHDAGMAEMGEPPEVVADAIVAGLRASEFHVFPDSFAKQIGAAYESFAQEIVEADLMEA